MNLTKLNQLTLEQAHEEFYKCCACHRLCKELSEDRPYKDLFDLLSRAEALWNGFGEPEFLEAFKGHSKIGDLDSLKKKYVNTRQWSIQEQAGIQAVDDKTLTELIEFNQLYEERFGFIFIVCATGKTASEMLAILKSRINNDAATELKTAAGEQAKITKIRLEKLL